MKAVLPLLCLLFFSANALNEWPIVGIFAQPSSDSHPDCGGSCQYIAASYVKAIESSGARVVPINFYASDEMLTSQFEQLNGEYRL